MNLTTTKTKILALTLLMLVINLLSARAGILYVDASKSGGDGQSWATAYGDLQTAIDQAVAANNDEIWVKNGTYQPDATDRNIAFTLREGIAIYGGFAGNETLRVQRDPINTATILSGDIGTNNDNSDNSYTIVFCQGLSAATILDGFIIQEANADGLTTMTKNGGGMFNDGSNVQIRYVQFTQNQVNGLGGALYNAGVTSASIEFCTFSDNVADTEGGAIYNAGLDGGISSPTIFQCIFTNNVSHFGGAIYNNGNDGVSNPKIISCEFTGNNATGGGAIAGAIYSFAKDGGTANPEITNCIFYGNSSVSSGGAVYCLGDAGSSMPTINNSTFFLNSAGTGGAVYVNESNGGDGEITINNSIFWSNSAGFNPTFHMSSTGIGATPTINLNHILIDAADCSDIMQLNAGSVLHCQAGLIFNSNPKFENGFAGDFRLQSTSPAIEAGDNSSIPFDISTDKDQNTRVMFDFVDLGAYESAASLPVELLAFDAQFEKDRVVISWSTASEINNDFFTVERSTDGVRFQAIDRQAGANNSNSFRRYLSYDEHPAIGFNYYRLKQTDTDGSFSYSAVKAVQIQSGRIRLYPNPVVDHLYLASSDFADGTAEYHISSLTGHEITRGQTEVSAGLSVIRFDQFRSLSPGTYIVRMQHPVNGTFSKKFVKLSW
ncbi:MAG: choice-of-anchor Q domain-containing protein [Bacteroidota bacterium]